MTKVTADEAKKINAEVTALRAKRNFKAAIGLVDAAIARGFTADAPAAALIGGGLQAAAEAGDIPTGKRIAKLLLAIEPGLPSATTFLKNNP